MRKGLVAILCISALTSGILFSETDKKNPEPTQTYSQQETQSTSEKPDLQRYSVLGTKKKSHDEKYPLRPDGTRPIEYYFPEKETIAPFLDRGETRRITRREYEAVTRKYSAPKSSFYITIFDAPQLETRNKLRKLSLEAIRFKTKNPEEVVCLGGKEEKVFLITARKNVLKIANNKKKIEKVITNYKRKYKIGY